MNTFEKNLAALGRWFPGWAERLAETPVPAGFETVIGTDGTPTFRREHARSPRRLEWLGNTSMPAASAEAIVTSLDPGTANGLGLGIGTGFEWLAFLAKLPRAQMLFVYEPEAGGVRMALEVGDLSETLGSGRLVLLPAEGAEIVADVLADFLDTHRGFEPPAVLHPLATLDGAGGGRRNALLATGEAIVRKAVLRRHALIERLAVRMCEPAAEKTAEQAREVAFLVQERYPGERPLHRQVRGTPTLYVDRHDQTAMARRLEILADVRPGVLKSDLFRSQLGPVVPAETAVETWIAPGVGAGYWERLPPASALGAGDRVVVNGQHHAALLRERQFGESQIVLRKPGSGPSEAARGRRERSGPPGRAVAIVADLPCVEAEAVGITLPTHLAVYAAARTIVEEEYLTVHEGCAEDVLRRAIQRAARGGANLAGDPALGEPMRRLIRMALIPTAPMLKLALELERSGIAVMRVGEWPEPGAGGVGAGVVCWPDGDGAMWREVAAVVHLSPTGMVLPPVLQAAERGVPVLAVEHATDRLAGSVREALGERAAAVAPARLVAAVKQILRHAGGGAGGAG
ncbi:MAG TPA: hypothetical protein VH253_12890 [Phycisphaerae bacterium]|nr:hypothetical protein [Phycisphaerae bacterium]